MQTMKKRVAQVLIGAVGLASVATAGVAVAANGDRSPSPSTGKTPTAVSTDDRRGHDGRAENEPGDDRGQHQEPGDDRGQHQEPGDDHGLHHRGEDLRGGNSGPGGEGEHGDNSGPGSNDG